MPLFVFAYRSPAGYARTAETAEAWRAWFADLGGHLAELGRPVDGARAALGNCDPGRTELGGYSLIEAPDLDAAVAIAQGCPHLDRDGGIEIGQLGEVLPASSGSPQDS